MLLNCDCLNRSKGKREGKKRGNNSTLELRSTLDLYVRP